MLTSQTINTLDQLADAPTGVARLRKLILDLAVRGKLVRPVSPSASATELLHRIRRRRDELIRDGKLRPVRLLKIEKNQEPFQLPSSWMWVRMGDALLKIAAKQFEAQSEDGHELFVFDVNRRGKIKLSKCTYQERYAVVEILVRLDLDGPPHQNPDGAEVPCPHLHVYREGFADKWAVPLPAGVFSDVSNLAVTLLEFFRYCNVRNIPDALPGLT